MVIRQGSTVPANVHESQAFNELEIRNNLIILSKIIFSLLKLILTESVDEILYCNHVQSNETLLAELSYIVQLIFSFRENEIRLFSGTLILGVKAKVSRGQTLK